MKKRSSSVFHKREYLWEEDYELSELKKASSSVAANPDKEVFIRADALVPYEKVAQLMAARIKALTKLGMVTEPCCE